MMKHLRSLLVAVSALAGLVVIAHAATLTATVRNSVTGSYRASNDLGGATFSFNQSLIPSIQLDNGTGSNQANLLFSDSRTLAASGTENIDLAASLTDPFGTTLTFVKVKYIKIRAATANTNNVVIGGAGSNTFTGPFADTTDKLSIPPGGEIVLVAPVSGWTVTAATGDILLIANSGAGTSVSYDIIIIGTNA